MPSLYAEVEINAPIARVWEILIAKQDWQRWNTFLFDCDPELPLRQGETVLLSMRRLEHQEKTEFEPEVTRMLARTCLQWRATIPGLRTMATFDLQEIGVGRTKYIHAHRFAGPLSRLLIPFVREDEVTGMRRMARELKRYAETGERSR